MARAFTPPSPKCEVCGQRILGAECEPCVRIAQTLAPEVIEWIKNVVEHAVERHEAGRAHNPWPEGY